MPKKLTTDIFIEKATIAHNGFYNYDKVSYINSYTKVCIICPLHGEFWQRPSHHLIGQTCFTCSLDKKPVCKKTTQERFVMQARNIHGDIYDYSKSLYIGGNDQIIITCRLHGDFSQIAGSHLFGHGCPDCGII
jgi:hypothetical protein